MLALWLLLQLSPPPVTYATSAGSVTTGGLYTAPAQASGTATITVTAGGQTVTVPVTFIAPDVVSRGIPYGPFGLWSSATTVAWGPAPFTAAIGASDPAGIVTQIQSARAMGQRLVLFMTGGAHSQYLTNGCFDLAKWKARQDRFNTAAIRQAVAAGVADGTVLGGSMMDEPEASGLGGDGNTWGAAGCVTKPMLDSMALYAKRYFPTLPMGVNHGPTGYQWRTGEHYRVVDYALNQYAWRIGPLPTWLANVKRQFAPDSVALAFSVNILGGGVQDRDRLTGTGVYDCTGPGQAGLGPYEPTCRTPADSLRVWGRALGPQGCFGVMWTYDATYMARTDNQAAFRSIADSLARVPRRSCRRPG